MNRNVIIGMVILIILAGLLAIVSITMKQTGNLTMTENKTTPLPKERILASFGLNQENVDSARIDMLLTASEPDIVPYYYPKGPVIGYGKDMNGSIIVMMDENQTVNQTLIHEIYTRISARGKQYNLTGIPCTFISTGMLKIDIAKDTIR